MNKYDVWYDSLINKAKSQNRTKNSGDYFENHHILPKSLGGSNDVDNLVLLTAREHFLAHWMLTKKYVYGTQEYFKTVYAFNSFCMDKFHVNRCTSKQYEHARILYVDAMKNNHEWRRKVSETMTKKLWIKKGDICLRIFAHEMEEYKECGWEAGRIIKHRQPHSAETKQRISESHKGVPMSDKFKENVSLRVRGVIWINNGVTSKFLSPIEAKEYLDRGWVRGRVEMSYTTPPRPTPEMIAKRKEKTPIVIMATNVITGEVRSYHTHNDLYIDMNVTRITLKRYADSDLLYRNEWSIYRPLGYNKK